MLEDEQVERALLEAVRRAEAREALDRERAERQETKTALEQALRQAGSELNGAREALAREQSRCEDMEAELEKNRALLKERESDLERLLPFRETVEAFERYRAMAAGLPEYLAQSLPRDDAVHFLAVGCQRDTIERLWDRFRERAEQLTAEQRETVEFLLAFFLARYNSLYGQPVYQLMLEEAGRPFDDRRHSRSPACSKYQGNVERVIFPGIWNLKKDEALRKSVVYFQQAY